MSATDVQDRFPLRIGATVAPRTSEDEFRDKIKQVREDYGAISGKEAYELAQGFHGVTRQTARKINREIGGNTKSGPISRTAETRRLIRDQVAPIIALKI